MPAKPTACRATSAAACGGHTETTTSHRRHSSVIWPASSSPARSARSRVAALRPSDAHMTRSPPATSAAPIAPPISPGCSSPTATATEARSRRPRGDANSRATIEPMPVIEGYEFGRVTIDGREETRDVIVLPHRVVRDWWRKDGHGLVIEDLDDVLAELPARLHVGTGAHGRMRP